jgi:hypothetical protein
VRKLAIVLLLVMVSCKRQVSVTSAPAQPAATANPNATGGASHRDALTRFLQAAKVQDVQALANVWGTTRGPARTDRTYMTVEQMEQRIIYMMRCLRHDSYTVPSETPAVGEKRLFAVQLKLGTLTGATDFTTTKGPEDRYYVETFDIAKVNAICSAR